jgi:toxin-antitoxin system PIN domain toxin
LSGPSYLLDVNMLLALTDPSHIHHVLAKQWFGHGGFNWGVCALSEAGFLRVTTNPKVRAHTLVQTSAILAAFTRFPGYRFWPMPSDWATLAAPFADRIYGHQQITDAYLLGLAIKENGVLVTLDRAFKQMAGPKYSKNVLVLE